MSFSASRATIALASRLLVNQLLLIASDASPKRCFSSKAASSYCSDPVWPWLLPRARLLLLLIDDDEGARSSAVGPGNILVGAEEEEE